jgi:hypothetical protein
MLTRSLRLVFTTPNDDTSAGSAEPDEVTPDDTGDGEFRATTEVRDMSPEEQLAYWKHHARKHERVAKATAAELQAEKDKNKTAEEKRDDEIRRQGEALGAERFLTDAVHGHVRALTGKADEDVADALSFVDPSRFLTDGVLDKAKLAAFASQLGTAAPQAPSTPQSIAAAAAAQMQRPGQATPASRGGGSISARRAEIAAALAAKQ